MVSVAAADMPSPGAVGGDTSLVKTTRAMHTKAVSICRGGNLFKEVCKHGNWVWKWAPCNSWGCEACRERRVWAELIPQIKARMVEAVGKGRTLKLVTLTWRADDVGAADSRKGRSRRRWDMAHLVQYVRRDRGDSFEYLRVPEYHRSGAVHLHLVADMPFVAQDELSAKWVDFARGSFKVDIEALGMRCPVCWPGKGAPRSERKRSMIIPPPGKGKCPNCGFEPDKGGLVNVTALGASQEAGKYLGGKGGRKPGKVTRSREWLLPTRKQIGSYCKGCCDEHSYYYVGGANRVFASHPGIEVLSLLGCRCYPKGGAACGCFGEGDWVESEDIDLTDALTAWRAPPW